MSDKDQAPKAKTPWIPMIAIAVICCGITGGGMYFLNHKEANDEEAKKKAPIVAVAPIYLKIDPFTVNIKSDTKPRLLYSGISLKLGNAETQKFLSEHLVEIRSRMLMIVADSKAEELVTPDGKAILTGKILDMLKLPFATPQPELAINELLFTDFIVQ
jgi:flagellar FliL protein